MKQAFLILMIAVGLSSCCNKKNTNTTTSGCDSTSVAGVISVDSFLVVAPDFLGKELTVCGTVDHVCKHGGKRVKLMGKCPSKSIHGEATEGVGAFSADIEGSSVCLTGIVAESKMDLAYIEEYEKSVKEANVSSAEESAMEHAKGIDHHAKLEQIANWKNEITTNGKGYISSYYLEVSKYNVCQKDSTTQCCSKSKSDKSASVSDSCGDKKQHEGCGEKH